MSFKDANETVARHCGAKLQTTGYPIGERVELPAHSDRWMMGDRFGEVTHIKTLNGGEVHLTVKLDKSGKSMIYREADCRWL